MVEEREKYSVMMMARSNTLKLGWREQVEDEYVSFAGRKRNIKTFSIGLHNIKGSKKWTDYITIA